jgi:phosphoribosyl-dephospho-CoA transferase
MELRPHDLVRVTMAADASFEDAPAWVHASLARAPWAVVRHDESATGQIPVGIRGASRGQRWATFIPYSGVLAIRTPESIRDLAMLDIPAARTLRDVAADLDVDVDVDVASMRWGPTGSVGFSLATGHIVAGPASDLDLLLRCPSRPARGWLDTVAELLADRPTRVDCQVETPAGIANLDDLRCRGPALVRTNAGPTMCGDPWAFR